jgi:3-oxoacyl-[acyl-carrier-protein] synthase II
LAIAVRSDGPKGNSSQPSRERIFVTACGVVSALGFGQTCVAEAVRQGQPGCRPVALPKLPAFPAGLVDEAAVARLDRRLDLRNMDRSSQWATVATRLALRQAGLPDKPATLAELGLFLNLSAGPSWAESEYLTSFLSSGHQVKHLLAFPYIVPSSVTGNVCRALRLSGPNLTLSGGPGAGLLGLGPAVSALRTAHTQALLCGAVDELSPRILTDCFLAGLGESEDSWPLGEGAVVLLLETEEHVDARGGTSLAELCGLALAMEPGPERGSSQTPSLCEDVVNEALRQADLRPDAVAAWCGDGPRALLAQLEAKFYPAWAQRRVNTARQTGWLEAGQALLNLAVALPGLPAGASLLAFSSHGPGGTGAAVFKKIDNSLPSPQESRATI